MKKSEALTILGLNDGATDEEVKKAHRERVIANHPDKFAQDPAKKNKAEEATKKINEARDVMLSRKWTPEYGRSPYANPYAGGYPRGGSSDSPEGGDPFAGWPFGQGQGQGQGQPGWVWTSWGEASQGQGTDNPFNPFGATAETPKTPKQKYEESKATLYRDLRVIGIKFAALAVLSLLGLFAGGLFLYVVASAVYALYKRLGSCFFALLVPIVFVSGPLLVLIIPRAGSTVVLWVLLFLLSFGLDVRNMVRLVKDYRKAKKKYPQAS